MLYGLPIKKSAIFLLVLSSVLYLDLTFKIVLPIRPLENKNDFYNISISNENGVVKQYRKKIVKNRRETLEIYFQI